jgi:hypothetical protein
MGATTTCVRRSTRTPEAEAWERPETKIAVVLEEPWRTHDEDFGNARNVRHLFDLALARQARHLGGRTVLDRMTFRRLEAVTEVG